MHLLQYRLAGGERAVGLVDGATVKPVPGYTSIRDLALEAIDRKCGIADLVNGLSLGEPVDYDALIASGGLLPPVDHPDPAHCVISGTGLTHLGSAAARDELNKKLDTGTAVTDTMRLFKLGLEGGKPADGPGVQPEWFYKGDGDSVVAPGQALPRPSFSGDFGEEPEVVAIYVIGRDGQPHRIGFAIGNEASDHVMEKQNYLYLAHSKMRMCSYGPEIVVGALPAHVEGHVKIVRNGAVLWEKPFLTGEANMSHSLANLEYHQFKYDQFLRSGDVHVVFLGTSVASFGDGVQTQRGDVFEIAIPVLGRPLRNAIEDSQPRIGFGHMHAL